MPRPFDDDDDLGNGGNGIDFGQYDDEPATGGIDDAVLDGLLETDDGSPYSGLRPESNRDAFHGDDDRAGFNGDEQPFDDSQGDDDGDGGDSQPPRQSAAGSAQRRGPQPGFMGQGGMSANERRLLGRDFWNAPNTRQQRQLSPSEQFLAQLTDRLAASGAQSQQRGPADDEAAMRQQEQQWNQFLGQRNFGQTADQMIEAFSQAGSDPEKSTRILHSALQTMARDVYRNIATDMQPTIIRIAETMAQRIVEQRMQAVTSERGFANGLASLLNRNPQWRQLGAYPQSALKQALAHSGGDMQRAIMLTERHIRAALTQAATRRNATRNSGGGQAINWHNEARR